MLTVAPETLPFFALAPRGTVLAKGPLSERQPRFPGPIVDVWPAVAQFTAPPKERPDLRDAQTTLRPGFLKRNDRESPEVLHSHPLCLLKAVAAYGTL